jgi:hypothetical protein
MPSDEERRELFDLLEAGLGSRGARLLMSQLPPVGWADLATKSDIGELRAEMAELRSELKGDMADLRVELKGEMTELRIELHDRLAGLAPRLWAANVATMIGLSGLVFAVATFAR